MKNIIRLPDGSLGFIWKGSRESSFSFTSDFVTEILQNDEIK